MAGEVFHPQLDFDNTAGDVFPNLHEGGGGNDNDEGIGVVASLGTDAVVRGSIQLPVVKPTGSPVMHIRAKAAATSGIAEIQIKLINVDVDGTISDLTDGTLKWTASASGTNEFFVTTLADSDPGINEPNALNIDAQTRRQNTLGSLAIDTWNFGDNDTLGFSTVYVRLSDGTDPDTKADGFIETIEAGEDGSSKALSLAGFITLEWTASDTDKEIQVKMPLSPSFIVDGERLIFEWTFLQSTWTLASVGTFYPRIEFE